MGDAHDRALERLEAGFERLGRRDVEVVGRLVEQQQVRAVDLELGVGYRYELYNVTTTPIVDRDNYDEDHFADVLIAFEYKNMLFEDRLEFTHTGSAKMPANAPEQYILSTEVILGVPLTEAWSFRASFFAEYINEQPDGINNTTTRSTVGLGYKF